MQMMQQLHLPMTLFRYPQCVLSSELLGLTFLRTATATTGHVYLSLADTAQGLLPHIHIYVLRNGRVV